MKKITILALIGFLGLAACATTTPLVNIPAEVEGVTPDTAPVCVFGVGIANNPDVEGKYVYGDVPIVAINPYSGHLLKAASDYLNSSRHNGRGVVEDLEKIYQDKGRVDMVFFHSAAVVALNGAAEKLDESLSAGRLRLTKIALAGVHVQPKLASVLDKHKEKGNIGDWLALENRYVPGKQRGDLIVLFTTPNREFRSRIGGAILKLLVGFEVGIIKFPALISGGKWDVKSPIYDFQQHLVEVYTPAARNFFGLEKMDSQIIARSEN